MLTAFLVMVSSLGIISRLFFSIQTNTSTHDGSGILAKLRSHKKHGFTYNISNALNFNGFFPRPMLFHYLISRLPVKLWAVAITFLNAFFDIASGLLGLILLKFYFGENLRDLELVLLFSLMIFSPILFPVTARLKAANNRTFGLFLNQCFFTILFYFDGGVISAISLVIILIVTVLSSTFATQLLLFVGFVYSLLSLDLFLLIVLCFSILIIVTTNIFGSRDILIFKYLHFQFNEKFRERNFSTKGIAFFFPKRSNINVDRRTFFIDVLLRKSTLLKLIWGVPLLFLLVYLLLFYTGGSDFQFVNLFESQLKLLLAVLVVFVFTGFGIGVAFGEAERYLELLAFMLPILLGYYVSTQALGINGLLFLLFAQLLIITGITFLSQPGSLEKITTFHSKFDLQLAEITEALKVSKTKRIAVIPFSMSRALSTLLEDRADIYLFYYKLVCEKPLLKNGMKEFMEDAESPNLFKIPPSELRLKYNIDAVLIEKKLKTRLNTDFQNELTTDMKCQYENISYALFVFKEFNVES